MIAVNPYGGTVAQVTVTNNNVGTVEPRGCQGVSSVGSSAGSGTVTTANVSGITVQNTTSVGLGVYHTTTLNLSGAHAGRATPPAARSAT